MTDIEQWEPDNVGAALETLDRVRAYLAKTVEVDDVTLIRDQGEAMAYWAREREMGRETEMIGQEIARRAERKLGELYAELREAGKVRGAGRPKKETHLPEDGLDDETHLPKGEYRAADLFDSQDERTAAAKFASIDDDTFGEAMAAARHKGDITRKGLIRVLREMGVINADGSRVEGDHDITPLGRVMTAVIRNLAGVVERLREYEPSTIESEKRKEWNNAIREHVQEIEAWRKQLPR